MKVSLFCTLLFRISYCVESGRITTIPVSNPREKSRCQHEFRSGVDRQYRFAQRLPAGGSAQAGGGGCSHTAITALRRTLCRADGNIAVEIGGRKQEFRRRTVGQMGDGGGGDVAAPTVFDRHGDAQGNTEIAGLPGFGEAAEFADLDVYDIHGVVPMGGQQGVDTVDGFIEDKGVRGAAANRKTGLVAETGLLDIDIHILDAAHDTGGPRGQASRCWHRR